MNNKTTLTHPEFVFIFEAISRLHAILTKEVTLNPRAAKTSGAQTIAGLYSRFSNYTNIADTEEPLISTINIGFSRHETRLMEKVCRETVERLENIVIPNYKLRIEKDAAIASTYQPYVDRAQESIKSVIAPLQKKLEKSL